MAKLTASKKNWMLTFAGMTRRIALLLALLTMTKTAIANNLTAIPDPSSQNMQCISPQAFINQFCKANHYNHADAEKIISDMVPQPKIIASMTRPAEKLSWARYRNIFITSKRVNAGQDFIEQNHAILKAAEKKYGVSYQIITAILGVETFYGTQQGGYRVLDALGTLAFCYPPREHYFQEELAQYFLLVRENNLDPLSITGSYAGAFGMPQFMPHSYRSYAVDYSNDHHADLVNNLDDSVMSIGNYLSANGWKHGQPIAVAVTRCNASCAKWANANPKAKLIQSAGSWEKAGVVLAHAVPKNLPAGLIALTDTNGNIVGYWLVFQNFKSIMSYNSSVDYAMAVYQLSALY